MRVASRAELIKGQVVTWADTRPGPSLAYMLTGRQAPGISWDFQYNYKELLKHCFDITLIHKHAFVLYYQIKLLEHKYLYSTES